MRMSIRRLCAAAAVAAVYAGLTAVLAPVSYGPVQFRLSEVLCILPFFLPFTRWGLFVGCLAANLLSAYGPVDVICGSLATLLAAVCASSLGRRSGGTLSKALSCIFPVLFNGIAVGGAVAYSTAGGDAFAASFMWNGFTVALGEAAVMYIIGFPLMLYLPRTRFFREIVCKYKSDRRD